MTTLKLSRCDVAPNGSIAWKSLKSLFFGYAKLNEEVIQNILVGAPVLESLELLEFCGFNRLDIGSASRRKLVVRGPWDSSREDDDSAWEISAPNLQSLSIWGCMFQKKLRLINIQSLDDCCLNFWRRTYIEDRDDDYEVHRNVLKELLQKLGHVKRLTPGNWSFLASLSLYLHSKRSTLAIRFMFETWMEFKVLSVLELNGLLSPLLKCKCLMLDSHIMKCDGPGIAGLLQSSLNLETLVINMTLLYDLEYEFDKKFPENYWKSELGSSKLSLLHLKTVKIIGFRSRHCEFGLVISLVQFLLEMGRTLGKIVINTRRCCRMLCSQKELLQVTQVLQSLPRISPHAVVMVSD